MDGRTAHERQPLPDKRVSMSEPVVKLQQHPLSTLFITASPSLLAVENPGKLVHRPGLPGWSDSLHKRSHALTSETALPVS